MINLNSAEINSLTQNIITWVLAHGIKIVLILIATILINRFLKAFIKKSITGRVENKILGADGKKRGETLISIFEGTFKFISWVIAFLMILPELGVEVAPLLAGVGVVGLAISMAARGIVSDFISGLFIILENQYYIGDRVKIAGIEGVVKEITLRRTIIEDENGMSHLIPNSKITIVSKKNK
jgi:small conductance mechanosensitive channel